jgi:hypothetical protein
MAQWEWLSGVPTALEMKMGGVEAVILSMASSIATVERISQQYDQ